MQSVLNQTEAQVSELRLQASKLSQALQEAARDLQATGVAPRESLIDELRSYRQLFAETRERVGRGLGTSLPARCSLEEMERAVQDRRVVDQALERVRALETAETADQRPWPPMETCLTACRAARDTLGGEPAAARRAAEELLHDGHPMTSLWRVLARGDELDDSAWEQAMDRVRQAFGREVATAASRGRLKLAGSRAGQTPA